jgi:hypothetical protein
MDWITVAEDGAGGLCSYGIRDGIDTVPQNVGYISFNNTSHTRKTKTKRLNTTSTISGCVQTGEAILLEKATKI